MAKEARPIHPGNALNRDFIVMTIPLLLMAFFYWGPKVFVLALVAVVTARLCDRLAAMLRGRRYDSTENSSVAFALIIVLMMPATVRFRVVISAVIVAVLVAKEAFGGYMSYPFNPAAVGWCVAAVSWPSSVMQYPAPTGWLTLKNATWPQIVSLWNFENVALQEGPSATLRSGGLPKIDFWNLLLGNYALPLGIGATLVIAACALYLLVRGRLPLLAPAAMLLVVVLIAFFFPRYSDISFATFPYDVMLRLQVVKYEVLGGSMLFAAVFLVPEPATLPKNPLSQLIYGALLGVGVMMFRYFGNYASGTCFAFLIVNAISGYFDRAISSKAGRRKGAALE